MNAPDFSLTNGRFTLPQTMNARGVARMSSPDDFRNPAGEYGMVKHANAGRTKIVGSTPACDACGRTDTPCTECQQEVADATRNG